MGLSKCLPTVSNLFQHVHVLLDTSSQIRMQNHPSSFPKREATAFYAAAPVSSLPALFAALTTTERALRTRESLSSFTSSASCLSHEMNTADLTPPVQLVVITNFFFVVFTFIPPCFTSLSWLRLMGHLGNGRICPTGPHGLSMAVSRLMERPVIRLLQSAMDQS